MQVHRHHQFMNNKHKNRSTHSTIDLQNMLKTDIVYIVKVFANGPFWTMSLKNGL
ncbi:hypothetical protein R6Q57_022907 [Mikania cordata]